MTEPNKKSYDSCFIFNCKSKNEQELQEIYQNLYPNITFFDGKVSVLIFSVDGSQSMLARTQRDKSCEFAYGILQKFIDTQLCVIHVIDIDQMFDLLAHSSWLIKIMW